MCQPVPSTSEFPLHHRHATPSPVHCLIRLTVDASASMIYQPHPHACGLITPQNRPYLAVAPFALTASTASILSDNATISSRTALRDLLACRLHRRPQLSPVTNSSSPGLHACAHHRRDLRTPSTILAPPRPPQSRDFKSDKNHQPRRLLPRTLADNLGIPVELVFCLPKEEIRCLWPSSTVARRRAIDKTSLISSPLFGSADPAYSAGETTDITAQTAEHCRKQWRLDKQCRRWVDALGCGQ